MNWINSSFIMFFSSVALYLIIRKSSLMKIPTQINNLAMFSIPLFVYLFIGLITFQNFLLSLNNFLIIIFVGIFLSYLGNVFSLKSIEFAPNPGYSLIISKSYVVFTTLMAVILFNAHLSIKNAMAIILIIVFSILIMVGKNINRKISNKLWLPLAFGAFFSWGLLSITSKYLFTQGVNIFVFLTYSYIIVTLCILLEIKYKKINFEFKQKNIFIYFIVGVLSTSFNFFNFYSVNLAPNIGYVNALNASSISIVTIFSILLFKDEYSIKKLVGVFGVIGGLILLLV